VFARAADYDRVAAGDRLLVADVRTAVASEGKAVVTNATQNAEIPVRIALSDRQKKIVLAGGLLPCTVSAAQG
jgi:aconitate hydratase